MQADILCTLLAQRLNPDYHRLSGISVVWLNEDGIPDENSFYKTPEREAIAADVIANYDTLAAQYELDQKPIRERAAYKAEADPIYIEWQALRATEHPEAENRRLEWLAKRAEIKNRFKEQ